MRKQLTVVLSMLLLASMLATALVAGRWFYSGRPAYLFLIWNLFLAWLPVLMALAAVALRRVPVLSWASGVAWLLFLPNAPYLLTDLGHLGRWGDAPYWFDLLLLLVFAITGLLLGFVSLKVMHQVVHDRLGQVAGWLFAIIALSLSSLGVYIGRFLRWNSWDMFVQPAQVLSDLFALLHQPWVHRQAYVFSMTLAVVLICAYVVLHVSAEQQPQRIENRTIK